MWSIAHWSGCQWAACLQCALPEGGMGMSNHCQEADGTDCVGGRARRAASPYGASCVVVITIIAIILSFVLMAAGDAARRAEERATQSLIVKLESGFERPARRTHAKPAGSQLVARFHGGGLEQHLWDGSVASQSIPVDRAGPGDCVVRLFETRACRCVLLSIRHQLSDQFRRPKLFRARATMRT